MNNSNTPLSQPPQRPRKSAHQSIESAALPDALLRIRTVVEMTGLSTATIYRKLLDRQFPQPVRLGARCTRWHSRSVRTWIAAQTPAA
jgi:prophage regulatory protein